MSQRTPRPPCMVKGCGRRVLLCEIVAKSGTAISSLHCKEHACRQRLGDRMCANVKVPGMGRFCFDHGICHHPGCVNPRVNCGTGQDYAYCQAHTCYTESCRQKRINSSKTCNIHTPRCIHPSCNEPRTDLGFYCAGHSCADANCAHPNVAGSWCSHHTGCTIEGCSKPRLSVTPSKVCADHVASDCSFGGCEFKVHGGKKVCPIHECSYPTCKEGQKIGDHGSSLPYCKKHTCQRPKCPLLVRDPTGVAPVKYCGIHTCNLASCTLAAEPGAMCLVHACAAPGCNSQRTTDPAATASSQFCTEHECELKGCTQRARGKGTPFCEAAHACDSIGCPHPRVPGAEICGHHLAEIMEELKMRGRIASWTSNSSAVKLEPDAMSSVTVTPPERDEVLNLLAQRHLEEKTRKQAAEEALGRGRKYMRGPRGVYRPRDASFDSGIGSIRSLSSEASSSRTFVN